MTTTSSYRLNPRTYVQLVQTNNNLDFVAILRAWKQQFHCNGTIQERSDDNRTCFMTLQGDRVHQLIEWIQREQPSWVYNFKSNSSINEIQ